jgi:hypothetical protein
MVAIVCSEILVNNKMRTVIHSEKRFQCEINPFRVANNQNQKYLTNNKKELSRIQLPFQRFYFHLQDYIFLNFNS